MSFIEKIKQELKDILFGLLILAVFGGLGFLVLGDIMLPNLNLVQYFTK